MTGDLLQRIWHHKDGRVSGFTKKYGVDRLVHYEVVTSPFDAIQREKSLKRWPRAWKTNLIERGNPDWADLYATWSRAQTHPDGVMDPRDKPEDDDADWLVSNDKLQALSRCNRPATTPVILPLVGRIHDKAAQAIMPLMPAVAVTLPET